MTANRTFCSLPVLSKPREASAFSRLTSHFGLTKQSLMNACYQSETF